MDANAYARQLKQLLPRGALWRLDPDSWLSRLLLGISDELARIDARGEDLLDEWDPRTATGTLDDWERVLALPDSDTPAGVTVPERQANITRKWIARGGATRAYFVELAAWLGYTVAIVETAPSTWRMDVSPPYNATTTYFRSGTAKSGDALFVRSSGQLEAVINRWKPAHTLCVFNYL